MPADNRARAEPILLASSNEGKLREYIELAGGALPLESVPNFRALPSFDEPAPTFAENAAGKALHYSRYTNEIVLADDSGLVVPALQGAPGVQSARYAGPDATDAARYKKLLKEMEGKEGDLRRAHFVCVIGLARRGRMIGVVSDAAYGLLTKEARGAAGFGYDPIFLCPELGRTFAELSPEEKNRYSHRGKAFAKVPGLLCTNPRL